MKYDYVSRPGFGERGPANRKEPVNDPFFAKVIKSPNLVK
jgi:hypothetical protein